MADTAARLRIVAPADDTKSRSGSNTRQRAEPITFRANAAERALIEEAADRAGLTVSSYVRAQSLARPVTRARW